MRSEKPIVPPHQYPIKEGTIHPQWKESGGKGFQASENQYHGIELPLEIITSKKPTNDLATKLRSRL